MSTLRGRALAPALEAGDAVGGVADEREQVGDRFGRDAVLLDDGGLVEHDVLEAIPRHDARADHALAQVLVDRDDANLLDARVLREVRGGGRDRVVGLELDHRPDDSPSAAAARSASGNCARSRGSRPSPVL